MALSDTKRKNFWFARKNIRKAKDLASKIQTEEKDFIEIKENEVHENGSREHDKFRLERIDHFIISQQEEQFRKNLNNLDIIRDELKLSFLSFDPEFSNNEDFFRVQNLSDQETRVNNAMPEINIQKYELYNSKLMIANQRVYLIYSLLHISDP